MLVSRYVLDAVSNVSISKSRRNYDAVIALREASEIAKNNDDTYILELISSVVSMSYGTDNHSFSPLSTFEGKRSFAMEDLKKSDIEILQEVSLQTDNVWIRTRLAHVVWILSNDYRYGQMAVSGYLQRFEETFDPEHWTTCNDAVRCAFHIASLLGPKSEVLKQTRTAINKKISAMDGTDPLYLSLSLLELVIKNATQEELESYLSIVSKLAAKNICAENTNTNLADETFSVQEMLLTRLKRQNDIIAAKATYASYYETHAELLAQKEDYLRAVIMLKQACNYYSTIDRDKLLALRSRLEELQGKAFKQMQTIPLKINTESIYKEVEQLFEGLAVEEAIVQIGRIATVFRTEEVKKQVLEKKEKFIFSALSRSSMINEKGQTVQELPPLSETDAVENSDVLFKHMVHYVSEQRRLVESITLGYAYDFLRKAGEFEVGDLDYLVSKNAIIPENRQEIIKEGLYLGLTGRLYAAMHILLPQTESIFRCLVKMCGDTVTYLKEDGTESYKPLSALFKSEKLMECYSEDIIFTFRSIMDEPIGENLRNLNAHGLLEPQRGNSASALCFLCLLIKLLVMYSPKAQLILRKLAAEHI